MIKKIIIGLIAGIVSGLFSTVGGMILVPSFIYLIDQHIAQGANLIFFTFNSRSGNI